MPRKGRFFLCFCFTMSPSGFTEISVVRRIIQMATGKFVTKQTKSGGFTFNLKAANGQVVATSQVYKSEATLKTGIESVKKNAPIAAVEDQTVEGFATEKNPKFEIYTDKKGEFRFRLKAKNGQIIATGEGYTTIKACKNGVASIQKNAPDAPVVKE